MKASLEHERIPFLGFRLSLCMIVLSTLVACGSNDSETRVNKATPNPYLASSLYAITHFDSAQSDSTPYGPGRNVYAVDPDAKPICYGGPINIITLASTNTDYMWEVGSDRVSVVHGGEGEWSTAAEFDALADASGGTFGAIPDENLRAFGESSAVGMDAASMDAQLKSLFGENYGSRFGNGIYSVVDKDNVLYTNYGNNLYGFAWSDPGRPSEGIAIRYKLENVVSAIQGDDPAPPAGTRLFGLSMTYDGRLIITFSNGVAVIDRDLNPASNSFYRFADDEYVSNSLSVDEHNGIYVASNKLMHKLVWTGAELSGSEADGAWSSPYDTSKVLPPIIKVGNGTGSTPTLMGFAGDADKLVVITDGAEQMKLVAFWRDDIPDGFVQKPDTASPRIAGQIKVTCGFAATPEWIQSEQSVVVHGYGAFVVNNIPETVNSEVQSANKILQVSLMGPAYPTSYGVERFQWNPSTHEWSSVWARSDVSSTSMVPIHSEPENMALVNGYTEERGWEVTGLDWDNGSTVHQTMFGRLNLGNGAYAILQYLEDGDLVFNSIVGPLRVSYND